MIPAALDLEFGFWQRAFDYTAVEPVCGVLHLADGPTITACPRLGQPWERLIPYLQDRGILIAMHHGASAERSVLQHLGLPFPSDHWWDTGLAERVLHISHDGDLARDKLIPDLGPYALLTCLRRRGINVRDPAAKKALQEKIGTLAFTDSDLPAIVTYCAQDVEDTLTLSRLQLADFGNMRNSMPAIFIGLFLPHALRLADMTAKGVLFDRQSYNQIVTHQERLLRGKQEELRQLGFVGEFSHLREKLTVAPQNVAVCRTLERLGLSHVLQAARVYKADHHKSIGERRRSLNGVFKEGHRSPFPFIRTAKDYHDLIELLSRDWTAYLDSDGRIRPAVVFPGSSSYRTIQVMPNPLMLPYFARPLFHAAPGNVLVELDFKAQEIGLCADWYNDPRLLDLYNTFTLDLYSEIGVAMGLYPSTLGQPVDPHADPELRAILKTAVLGLQYGEGPRTLSGQLNLPLERATDISRRFWATFAEVKQSRELYLRYTRTTKCAVNRAGFVRGYRPVQRRQGGLRDTMLSYANYPIQSGGAAVLMVALAELPPWTNPVLTMHDAILLEVPQKCIREAAEAVQKAMASALGALFPRLRCRCDVQAAWRYHKESPGSLHAFCGKLGLTLQSEVGWHGLADAVR